MYETRNSTAPTSSETCDAEMNVEPCAVERISLAILSSVGQSGEHASQAVRIARLASRFSSAAQLLIDVSQDT